jgi:hypothetical protein
MEGVQVQLHAFLNVTLEGSEWSVSRSGERASGTHWIGGRKGLDMVHVWGKCEMNTKFFPEYPKEKGDSEDPVLYGGQHWNDS